MSRLTDKGPTVRSVVLSFSLAGFLCCLLLALKIRNSVLTYESEKAYFAVGDYVAGLYLPAERRKTKRWPQDLDGFDTFLHAVKDRYPRSDIVRRCYHEEFQSIEILGRKPTRLTFKLHFRGRTLECASSVNPDEGGCS